MDAGCITVALEPIISIHAHVQAAVSRTWQPTYQMFRHIWKSTGKGIVGENMMVKGKAKNSSNRGESVYVGDV